jgi:adenosylhomocysteine nucleosidase
MKLLAVVPTDREFDALLQVLEGLGLPMDKRQVGRLPCYSYLEYRLLIAQGGLGKAQFGVQMQHLLDHSGGIGLAVCAGTAGGLVPGLTVGDVVIGTETVEHDFTTAIVKTSNPRFKGHAACLLAVQDIGKSLDGSFALHFGPIASGDEGIVDSSRAREIQERTGALAVAWEGAGGARAAQFSGVPYLEIRGISDGADHNAMQEFFKNIPIAMKNVAAVLKRLAEMMG